LQRVSGNRGGAAELCSPVRVKDPDPQVKDAPSCAQPDSPGAAVPT
jgi:hypothetical protein